MLGETYLLHILRGPVISSFRYAIASKFIAFLWLFALEPSSATKVVAHIGEFPLLPASSFIRSRLLIF